MNATNINTHAETGNSARTLTVEDLLEMKLLAGEDAEVIDWLLDAGRIRDLAAGETLFTPGQKNDKLYLVLRGELVVSLDSGGKDCLDRIRRGDCIGEMSVLEGLPASAYVMAAKETRLFMLKDEHVWSLINHSHVVARNLLLTLSGRIRKGQKVLSESFHLQRSFEQDAKIDYLTGLYNRRWLNETLPRLVQRDRTLSLLILDIDYFKRFNDTHGHVAGDNALISVANTLLQQLRPTDMAARYGGEEIVALLPATDEAQARDIAERVRGAVAARVIQGPNKEPLPPVTVSIGFAQLVPGEDGAALLGRADAALYRAKSAGRNCIQGQ